jgi:predicted secreted protein
VTLAVAALTTAVLMAVACGGGSDSGETSINYLTVTKADDGATIKAALYDVITVTLAEDPEVGYWNASTTAGLTVTNTAYTADDASGGTTGTGGVRTWKVRVDQLGESRFVASFDPSGDTGGGQSEPVHFTFKVVAE